MRAPSSEPLWPEPVERVSRYLRERGVSARVQEFPEGTPSARDAARAVGVEPARIVKSLVFVCDGAYVLVLVPGDRRADEARIATALGAKAVRVARPDEVVHATGFEPGGVAPFPQRAVARAVMERTLAGFAEVWVGAGTDAHLAGLSPLDLQRLAGAAMFDLVQHR